jgi:hypothetical protein
MIVWAYLKIAAPVSYAGDGAERAGIFAGFYGVSIGQNIVLAIGYLQIAFLLAYLAGLFKTITVGGVLLMNIATLIVSMPKILNPFEQPNLLFLASVPILGASLAHFLMRKDDTLLSLGK